ncbi:MAG: pyrroline-5-carboxylate reductase family protein [Candidatus Oleimicrobiaceae bacterium]
MNVKEVFGFVGGGRVTRLLLTGLRRAQALPHKVVIYDPDPSAIGKLAAILGDRLVPAKGNAAVASESALVFLAVHPPVMEAACAQVGPALGADATVISLVPTITTRRLARLLGGFSRIVRMIPNAPSLMGHGFNPVTFSAELGQEDRTQLQELFRHWGVSPEVPEGHLEAYAVLTGMGPTYFWFQWLTLKELAVRLGLAPRDAEQALAEMLHGAVEILFASDLTPEEVLDLIPSYPLKKDEDAIQSILRDRLWGVAEKLRSATQSVPWA